VDRQSQTVDIGVTVGNCKMKRLLFADELVLHAWIFATGSSARIWSVFCCVQPRRNENQLYLKRLRYYVSYDAQGSVSWKWAEINCSRCRCLSTMGQYSRATKVGIKGLIHGLVKKRSSAWALFLRLRGCGLGAFKERKAFSLNRLCSDPHLWSWILGDDWKNTVKRTNGSEGILAKSFRCDTSWQRAQVWNA